MARRTNQRTLAVILHADVAGSTRLVQRDETVAHERITETFQRLSATIHAYGGVVHEIRGDALLADFARASDAVCSALQFQADNGRHNARFDDDITPVTRIGISLGEVIIADNTLTGPGVVLAQRLEQLAEPGGLCIQSGVYEAMPSHLPFDCQAMGERLLKGFDEPVRAYAVKAQVDSEIPLPETRASPIRRTATIAAIPLLILVIAAAFAWWQFRNPRSEPTTNAETIPPLPEKPSVAVLPFDNLSDDPSQEYFADGLTDDLIIDLSKISGLFVIARNSVFTFKGTPVRVKTVAEDLGVRYVIEGSIRRAGNRIRVNAQLIEGTTGHHVWAERYDREVTDLFAVQDELVDQIVSALAVRLTRTEKAQLVHRPAPTLEAYELYLRARDGYFSRDQGRMRESLDLYTQATAIDPTFARAYAGLAQVAADMWRLSSLRESMGSAVQRKIAAEAAMKALELDPSLPDAHSVLALLRLAEGNHDAALKAARRAVELEPNSADAHTSLAIVLGYAGHPDSALESIRTAARLNPRPPPHLTNYYGWALFLNQQYEDAIAVLEPIATTRDRGIADAPRELLAMAYAKAGHPDKARAQVASLREQEPFLNLAWYRQAYNYHARDTDLQLRLDALRTAGMPEWPLGFEGDPDKRLNGAELENLIFGRGWSGRDAGRRVSFIQEFGKDGDAAYASATTLLTGKAFIEDNELCEQFEGFSRSLEFCGPVYRHQDSESSEGGEYAYVNPITVRYFSLQP